MHRTTGMTLFISAALHGLLAYLQIRDEGGWADGALRKAS